MVKEHRFSFKQKDGRYIFCIISEGSREVEEKQCYVNVIYKPQEIDRCGKFRRKRGNAGQKL